MNKYYRRQFQNSGRSLSKSDQMLLDLVLSKGLNAVKNDSMLFNRAKVLLAQQQSKGALEGMVQEQNDPYAPQTKSSYQEGLDKAAYQEALRNPKAPTTLGQDIYRKLPVEAQMALRLGNMGLETLSVPGAAVGETAAALSGQDYNYKNILPTELGGNQRFVSDVAGIENPYLKFGVDLVTDPTTWLGAGYLKNLNNKNLVKLNSLSSLEDFKTRISTEEGRKRLQDLQDATNKAYPDPEMKGFYEKYPAVRPENAILRQMTMLPTKEGPHYWDYLNTVFYNDNVPVNYSKPIARHEMEHGVQNIIGGKNKLTSIDKSLANLELVDLDLPTFKNYSLLDKVYNKLYPFSYKTQIKKGLSNRENAIDYFETGSNGREKSPFLAELQQYLVDNKHIKHPYDYISPELIKEVHTSKKNYPLRILDIITPTDKNYDLISSNLNKMLTSTGAIGTGAILNQDRTTERYGRRVYQNGGYKLPEITVRVDNRPQQLLLENMNKPMVKRMFEPNAPQIYLEGETHPSTHLMQWGEVGEDLNNPEGYFVTPSLIQDNKTGKLRFAKSGETNIVDDIYLPADKYSKQFAEEFSEKGYKQAANDLQPWLGGRRFQNGGVLDVIDPANSIRKFIPKSKPRLSKAKRSEVTPNVNSRSLTPEEIYNIDHEKELWKHYDDINTRNLEILDSLGAVKERDKKLQLGGVSGVSSMLPQQIVARYPEASRVAKTRPEEFEAMLSGEEGRYKALDYIQSPRYKRVLKRELFNSNPSEYPNKVKPSFNELYNERLNRVKNTPIQHMEKNPFSYDYTTTKHQAGVALSFPGSENKIIGKTYVNPIASIEGDSSFYVAPNKNLSKSFVDIGMEEALHNTHKPFSSDSNTLRQVYNPRYVEQGGNKTAPFNITPRAENIINKNTAKVEDMHSFPLDFYNRDKELRANYTKVPTEIITQIPKILEETGTKGRFTNKSFKNMVNNPTISGERLLNATSGSFNPFNQLKDNKKLYRQTRRNTKNIMNNIALQDNGSTLPIAKYGGKYYRRSN